MESSNFVPREHEPQQQAQESSVQETGVRGKKEARQGGHAVLQKALKELGQVTDPELKEACRGRKKSLKALLNILQDCKSSPEEKQQLLIKTLANQVAEVTRLEKMVVPLQKQYESCNKLRELLEAELEKKTALGSMLQEVARSLQSKNKQLEQELELRAKQEAAHKKYKEDLDGIVQQFKDRADSHKEMLDQLQETQEHNSSLSQQVSILLRQIELQKELASKQEARNSGLDDLLEKHKESDKEFRSTAVAAMDEMGAENRRLQEKCKQQDEVMSRHQQQFDECAFVIDEVKKGMETQNKTLAQRNKRISSLETELRKHGNVLKALEVQLGKDVVAGAHKAVSQKCALEKLCRALKEENRSLKAASVHQGGGAAKPGEAAAAKVEADQLGGGGASCDAETACNAAVLEEDLSSQKERQDSTEAGVA